MTSSDRLSPSDRPHALFLGSSLATLDRVAEGDTASTTSSINYATKSQRIKQSVKALFATRKLAYSTGLLIILWGKAFSGFDTGLY